MFFLRTISTGLKYIWKTLNLIREIFLNLMFFFILLSIFAIIGFLKNPKEITSINQSGVLILDIQGSIVDSTSLDEEFFNLTRELTGKKIDTSRENSLFELTQKITQATSDPEIKGIILKLDSFIGADLPSLKYIAKYLAKFKESGKPIYAFGSSYDQKQYFLASMANKIYLANQGNIALYGFSTNNLYYKTLLDNLKINTHVFRVGTYKSAVEPFIRDDMSEEARDNTSRWLTKMWNNYVTDISIFRKEPANQLVPNPTVMLEKLKEASGNIEEYALQNKIVDNVVPYYQFVQEMKKAFNNANTFSIYDYKLTSTNTHSFNDDNIANQNSKPMIAVVFINGAISVGESERGVAGSETITKQLQNIRNNPNIHAVVLRINSPGGGVYASETIRNELIALRKKDIPVVVSMGGMAASGGYWIASESDYIIADPNTITGSIGIFGIITTFENSLSQIGVHSDGVSTSPLAGLTSTKELSPEFNKLMQMNIESGYNTFVSLVSKSRSITYKGVDNIGQGQVWLGQEAKEIGLVDELGDFDDAINKAATLAELSDYVIDWQKQQNNNIFYSLMNNYSAMLPKSFAEMVVNQLPMSKQISQNLAFWDKLNDPQNQYAYCLNCADIK